MKLKNALTIFVAILFLISPIEILCEKVPKYTKINHIQRKLEENGNYIMYKYGTNTAYGENSFTKIDSRKQIQYIKYKDEIVDLTKQFTIEANTNIEIYFSEPITSLNSFFSGFDDT